jgi:hypothetical protein
MIPGSFDAAASPDARKGYARPKLAASILRGFAGLMWGWGSAPEDSF